MVPSWCAAALLVAGAWAAPPPRGSSAVPSPSPSASPSPAGDSVIVFLIDNSASLPPLDPEEKRVAALEKMFSFLQGQRYRLVLFGGKDEIFVDDVSRYRNTGQWTDFYFAFERARELMSGHPTGTDFRMVLVTDAILDPNPADWSDRAEAPPAELRAHVAERTVALLKDMEVPLYVILVGDAPYEGEEGRPERMPDLILSMVQAANGARATPLAQSLAGFFADDGLLLKKFVFRVAPHEGMQRIKPIVTRIAAPSAPMVEAELLGAIVVPLALFLVLLLGILVRQFPGPGDVEVVELATGTPTHLDVDRLHKVESGWSRTGLSLVGDAKDAAATVTWHVPSVELTGKGVDTSLSDELTLDLLKLSLPELRAKLEELGAGGKDGKIFTLNLDYAAKALSPAEVERTLTAAVAGRAGIPALDFLRAKAHLLSNDELRTSLLDPRATIVTYGKGGVRKDLKAGDTVRIGRYRFLVQEVKAGGRKDARVLLYYDRIPSLLGLKNWVPDRLQQLLRFRRSRFRLVT